MDKLFAMLDGYIASFMQGIFEAINNFWANLYTHAGQGGYICFLLIALFVAILLLIGLFKLFKKFGLLIFLVILTIGIPCLWFFLVLPNL